MEDEDWGEDLFLGDYPEDTPGALSVIYDEIIHQTKRATLFLVSSKEVWLANEFISIDKENKEVIMAKWLYDKHFI